MNRALIVLGAGTAVLVGVWASSGSARPLNAIPADADARAVGPDRP